MRFNATLGVDFAKWSSVKMERENNMKEFRGIDEDAPKFGAGSEFGKEAREEARRKKLGIMTRKYKPDDQPWLLKAGGTCGKKFKGIREGGVSENAAYYVFTHATDGAIEAFPLNEWYKFQPIQRYKSLSAEEAEQEFGKRNKVLNYFSLMLRKRLKGDEDLDMDEGEETKGKKNTTKKAKDLKISDMDEWMESSDDSSEEEEEKNEEEKQDKKKKTKKVDTKKKKPKRDTDLEAFEDSDDGDNEGRELDYISDSSESEPENSPSKDLQGVSEEKALRKLLTSDEDSEDEENKSEKEPSNEEEDEKQENKDGEKEGEKKKSKKKQKKKEASKKKKEKDKGKEASSSDFSSDSTDSETDNKKAKDLKEIIKIEDVKESTSSRSASPSQASSSQSNKRKLPTIPETVSAKKPKFDTSLSNYIPGSSESGITEDAVRRYLMRKPMTTTELLQKFKSKKTGLSSEQLVNIMTQILKKINPLKQTIKGKMYLSITKA